MSSRSIANNWSSRKARRLTPEAEIDELEDSLPIRKTA